jgi:hypothetical protein
MCHPMEQNPLRKCDREVRAVGTVGSPEVKDRNSACFKTCEAIWQSNFMSLAIIKSVGFCFMYQILISLFYYFIF